MKVIVCGSRDHTPLKLMTKVLEELQQTYGDELLVITGGCKGVDKCAELVCKRRGIACKVFPANWKRHGRAAGPIRNKQMLEQEPNLVLAFHPDLAKSKGTRHMVRISRAADVEVVEYNDLF